VDDFSVKDDVHPIGTIIAECTNIGFMICPRCAKLAGKKIPMKDIKRKGGFHKQTKYQCKSCGLVRMKSNKK